MASHSIDVLWCICQRRHLTEDVIHLRQTNQRNYAVVVLEILAADYAAHSVVNIYASTSTCTEVGVALVALCLEYAFVVLQTYPILSGEVGTFGKVRREVVAHLILVYTEECLAELCRVVRI